MILIFAGKTAAKVVAFLAVGLAGALFGGTLAAQYVAPSWTVLGLLLGFVIGGLLGVALLAVGVGLVAGYATYLLALDLALGSTIALITGVVFFVVGLALSGKILTLATAVFGGLILSYALAHYGFGPTFATVIAVFVTLIGLWIQLAPSRRTPQPTTTSVGGQPGASS